MIDIMISEAEHRVFQLAGQQSGYVTRRQAIACGMSHDALKRRVSSTRWVRVKPGLFLIPGFTPSVRGHLLAATAALGAVVSHESAAEVHQLPGIARGLAVVTVPTRTTNRFPDVVVHQSTDLSADEVLDIGGLPVTDQVRTAIDLASRLKSGAIGRIIDHLVVAGLTTVDDIGRRVAGLARQGKPGMRTMHKVLELRAGEDFMGESELEMLGLRLFREWGFPEPVLQFPLPWRSFRTGRVDLAYPELRLIIELDGRKWHSTLEAFEKDRLRDNHAQLAGWRVLRVTYRMLKEQPEMVRSMISQALAG